MILNALIYSDYIMKIFTNARSTQPLLRSLLPGSYTSHAMKKLSELIFYYCVLGLQSFGTRKRSQPSPNQEGKSSTFLPRPVHVYFRQESGLADMRFVLRYVETKNNITLSLARFIPTLSPASKLPSSFFDLRSNIYHSPLAKLGWPTNLL